MSFSGAPEMYALFDNARRARLGVSREEYARAMGELFAPFTRVAAKNPHASAPVERDSVELVTPTEKNRPIADPYTRYIVARDQVNQSAAVLLMSVAAAQRLGVPHEKRVFLHGHADLRERDLLDRADLSVGPASVMAARHALEIAGVNVDEVATFDFYSCFPIALFNTAVDGLGLAADDPRGLTLTGGLPFFGGAGNNYSTTAPPCRRRSTPGQPRHSRTRRTAGPPSRPTRSSTTARATAPASSSAAWRLTDAVSSLPRRKATRRSSTCSRPASRSDSGSSRRRPPAATGSPPPAPGWPGCIRRGFLASATITRVLPPKLANEMILTGRRITAEEALQHGLVNRVVPAGTALDGARGLAQEILAASPTSVRISLQVMEETQGIAGTVESVTRPTGATHDLLLSDGMIEGLTAFAHKRRPRWKNR